MVVVEVPRVKLNNYESKKSNKGCNNLHLKTETRLGQSRKRLKLQVVVRHIFREGNHAADYLASIGYDYPFGSHTVSSSDCNLVYHLRYDCLGISETRLTSLNN
ncbi:hypothetical protein LINPERHAP2_LOCUS6507 [Linum perenne]